MDGLAFVLLAVDLDQQPKVGPGEINASHETAFVVADLELADRIRQAIDGPRQLDHQCLEQTPGRWRIRGPQGEHSTDAGGARGPGTAHLDNRALEIIDRRESLSERRLERPLPLNVGELAAKSRRVWRLFVSR